MERNPGLESIVLPRTVIAWLTAVSDGHCGSIPGVPNSLLSLSKSDSNYNGTAAIGDFVHSFDSNSLLHIAASISVSLGATNIQDSSINPEQIQKLGKSIDLLIKAKRIIDLKKARELPLTASLDIGNNYQTGHLRSAVPVASHQLPNKMWHHVLQGEHNPEVMFHHLSFDQNPKSASVAQLHGLKEEGSPFAVNMAQVHPDHQGKGFGRQLYHAALQHHGTITSDSAVSRSADKAWGHLAKQPGVTVKFGTPGTMEPHTATINPVMKVELPGDAGKANAPDAPTPPVNPKTHLGVANAKTNQASFQKSFKLKPSDMQAKCNVCGDMIFRGEVFSGCLCLKSLAKSINITKNESGIYLKFNDLDEDAKAFVLQTLRK